MVERRGGQKKKIKKTDHRPKREIYLITADSHTVSNNSRGGIIQKVFAKNKNVGPGKIAYYIVRQRLNDIITTDFFDFST